MSAALTGKRGGASGGAGNAASHLKRLAFTFSVQRLDLDAPASQVSGRRAARAPNRQDRSFMAFVQFTQPDDQPIVINTDRIVTATPLPDGQGTRITFNNGGHQDVKQLIADVLRQLNISA
ncbi:hypothetical protein ACH79_07475 [Bradyrhizobium sp. CCBAU 051011]|nr:hypothetical protein ACH79_07475 [Bradyrhizobium sp. CCBAU 051011]